jgi:GTPase SAR1 family protein
MAAKQRINIAFLGDNNSGKTTIINSLLENYIVGKHENLCEIRYGANEDPVAATDDNLNTIYHVNFDWGKNTLFDCSMINYGSNEKLLISELHSIDYLFYILDSTNLPEKKPFFEYLFKSISKNKYLTKVSVIFNKYDHKFKQSVDEYVQKINVIREEFNIDYYSFRIDARKGMVLSIATKNKSVLSIPQDILFDFYDEYFGKILSDHLIKQTRYDYLCDQAFNRLSFSESEKAFIKYIKAIPNNKTYYQEKCATLTTHILDYMKKNCEKEFTKYIDFIAEFIDENRSSFNDDNIIKIYCNAFQKYYELNTTLFRIEVDFVTNVFFEVVKIIKSDVFNSYVNKESLISTYLNKTMSKIRLFEDTKNINYLTMINFINDNLGYFQLFASYYLPECIKHGFFKYKEQNSDETSDDESEDSDTENTNFMFVTNFIIKYSHQAESIDLINTFVYFCVLNCLPYPTECLLKVMRSVYLYADRIYTSVVGHYKDSEKILKMKFNYMTKSIDVDYDFIRNNTIMKLIKILDEKYPHEEKDFIYPSEIIQR